MKKIRVYLFIVVLALALMAFQVFDEPRFLELLGGAIGFVLMLFGPKPLKTLYDLLGIPGGPWRLFATYVASVILAVLVLFVMGFFADLSLDIDTIMAIAGVIATAAGLAYHRLKDLYGPSLSAPSGVN